MPKFFFNKLIRSKIIENTLEKDTTIFYKETQLNDLEYLKALKNKLCEETAEVIEAEDKSEIISELADVKEVILALTKALGCTDTEIEAARKAKALQRGDFSRKTRVLYVKINEEANTQEAQRLLKYCRENPDKYSEEP